MWLVIWVDMGILSFIYLRFFLLWFMKCVDLIMIIVVNCFKVIFCMVNNLFVFMNGSVIYISSCNLMILFLLIK